MIFDANRDFNRSPFFIVKITKLKWKRKQKNNNKQFASNTFQKPKVGN